MNYGQFIYMFPEFALVIALIIVFAFDFAMTKSGELRGEKANVALGRLTWFMLMAVGLAISSAMRQEETITAFGGMYHSHLWYVHRGDYGRLVGRDPSARCR